MKASRIWWVYLAAVISVAGVVIHVGAVFGGPSWFAFFNAPPRVVASAQTGTWLAPVSALAIASLMAVCAIYAGSVLGWVRRPPLQRTALATITVVCLLRVLILPPLALVHPDLRNTFEGVSAIVWFFAGIGFAVAFSVSRTGLANHQGGPASDRLWY
jgi:hypothetical protein